MFEISDADLKFFDEMFPKIEEKPADECNHNWIRTDQAITCDKCGVINGDVQVYIEKCNTHSRNFHVYHRKSYFLEKLRLMSGRKQSQSPKYNDMITFLKTKNIKTLFHLKKVMKVYRYKYSKFYKYIYSIFFDLTGKREIELSLSDIEKLSAKFLELERKFKKLLTGRSNFPSYNLTIYFLLKREGYGCYKKVILPKNEKKIIKIFELLIN